jgi:hypothetical protein
VAAGALAGIGLGAVFAARFPRVPGEPPARAVAPAEDDSFADAFADLPGDAETARSLRWVVLPGAAAGGNGGRW